MTASGIGIIRMSGPKSREIAGKIYRSKNGKNKIEEVKSHTINYGFIYDGDEEIDEVLRHGNGRSEKLYRGRYH